MKVDQLLTKGDLEDFKVEMFEFISRNLNKQIGDAWLKGEETREILKCGATKLSELVKGDFIETKGEGRGKLYSRKSIERFVKDQY